MLRLTVVLTVLGVALGAPKASVPSVGGRILGGSPTDISRHPYQLELSFFGEHICGAVLIAHNWAITTAHCTSGWLVRGLAVRAGSTTRKYGGQIADVERVIYHPEFNSTTLDYNFALLSLRGSIAVRDAEPVNLPEPNYPVRVGDLAVITGWGLISVDDSDYSDILYQTVVPVISFNECLRAYDGYILTERMFCAGHQLGGQDATHGDRGGPVIINGRLAGLISWAIGHAAPEYPGVYANVASVRGWIAANAGV